MDRDPKNIFYIRYPRKLNGSVFSVPKYIADVECVFILRVNVTCSMNKFGPKENLLFQYKISENLLF